LGGWSGSPCPVRVSGAKSDALPKLYNIGLVNGAKKQANNAKNLSLTDSDARNENALFQRLAEVRRFYSAMGG